VIREFIFTVFWATSLTLTLLFVAARMLHVGLSVEATDLEALRRHPNLLGRALLANFVIVPALGMTITAMAWVPPNTALAILLLAMLAGGVDVLALADTPAGEHRLEAPLTFVLALAAGLISPIVRLLMQRIGAPMMGSLWVLLGVTVLTVPVPLVAGLLVRHVAPAFGRLLGKATALVAVILFVAAAAGTALLKAPLGNGVGMKPVLAMVMLITGAGLAGWLLGGRSVEQRALLVRATVRRNVGLSLMLAMVAFPNAAVDLAVLVFVVVDLSIRLLRLLTAWTGVPSMATLWSRRPRPSR
jgi:BASS family bile acid:Na+ symporter